MMAPCETETASKGLTLKGDCPYVGVDVAVGAESFL